jgi:beta-barrel assembly-enhancing protease
MKTKTMLSFFGVALLFLTGCVTNPITGEQQFNMVSQGELLNLSRQAVPEQFGKDYGIASDKTLNGYVQSVGKRLLAVLKPSDMIYQNMPFSFQVVNATYVNAYAFPDGTIAITRGMLLEMENEAQLAAVLGHEIAHVNCGHTASAMSKGTVMDLMVGGTSAYLTSKESSWAEVATMAGQIGTTALLANYSRDQERQADQGGMEYMVRAGYHPKGMVELMNLLVRISTSNPSMVEQMFSSHPMSTERLETAKKRIQTNYASVQGHEGAKEYATATAGLRSAKPAINAFAKAETQVASKQAAAAIQSAQKGLALLPNDPAGTLILADAYAASGQISAAKQAATAAVNSSASLRAESMLAQCALQQKDYATALTHLNTLESKKSSDPRLFFYKGVAYEGLNKKAEATKNYDAYLIRSKSTTSESAYARQRLQKLAPSPAQK